MTYIFYSGIRDSLPWNFSSFYMSFIIGVSNFVSSKAPKRRILSILNPTKINKSHCKVKKNITETKSKYKGKLFKCRWKTAIISGQSENSSKKR